MEVMRYPIKLNMENTGALITSIRMKQGDSGMTLVLRIYQNGVNVYDAEDIPSIVFSRPDGSSVVGECSVAEGQYTYKMLGNELQFAGQIRADVKFNIYTETESTVTFLFECVKDTLPQDVQGASIYVNDLKDIKDYLDTTVTTLEQELEAFDMQQVLDAVTYINESKEEIEELMPQIENLKSWTGTTDEYEAAVESGAITDGTIVNFTDDYTPPESMNATEVVYTKSSDVETSVAAELDLVNNNLTTLGKVQSVTLTNSAITNIGHYNKAYRVGNVCIMTILVSINSTTTFSALQTITTLPFKGDASTVLTKVDDGSKGTWIRYREYNVEVVDAVTLIQGTYCCQIISPILGQ